MAQIRYSLLLLQLAEEEGRVALEPHKPEAQAVQEVEVIMLLLLGEQELPGKEITVELVRHNQTHMVVVVVVEPGLSVPMVQPALAVRVGEELHHLLVVSQ
mgnify:CR=1 FL=1